MSEWSSGYITDIGYTHGFYRELTPAILTFVSLAKGQVGFDPNASLAICELGCGQGLSANLLAAANPHIEFYATDFNPAQIVGASRLAAEAETANVHFFENSFAEFLVEPSLPMFDAIVLHGIYSWIHARHRAEIVEFIRLKLKPGGIVYISYNALPGWSAAAPMRHLMYLHGKLQGGPSAQRLDPAFDFIGKMLEADAGFFRANPTLKERFDKLRSNDKQYLVHEYLNEAWTLLYHSEVAAELEAAKLTYVGCAALIENLDVVNLSAKQIEVMNQFQDPVMRETVRDYMVNQQFRRDVFVRGAVALSGLSSKSLWADSRFVLSTRRADVPLKIKGIAGEVSLKAEIYNPILDAFQLGPRTVRQLVADRHINDLGWLNLTQALVVLVGSGHLQPCLSDKNDAKRSQRTKAFNKAVMNRALSSGDLQFLASPVTGGGIQVDRFSQMFILGLQQKQSDVAAFAWNSIAAAGEKIVKAGTTLETPEENLTELRERFAEFEEKRLPVLKHLGIV
jgi:SAM-dependent methyltransferase